jgi:hypothetical protein
MRLGMTQVRLMLAMGLLAAAGSRPAEARLVPLPPECGTLALPDRAAFDDCAARSNFPGAMQVPEVKFLITDVDTPAPQLYFMNSRNHPYHYDFVVAPDGYTLEEASWEQVEAFFESLRPKEPQVPSRIRSARNATRSSTSATPTSSPAAAAPS